MIPLSYTERVWELMFKGKYKYLFVIEKYLLKNETLLHNLPFFASVFFSFPDIKRRNNGIISTQVCYFKIYGNTKTKEKKSKENKTIYIRGFLVLCCFFFHHFSASFSLRNKKTIFCN